MKAPSLSFVLHYTTHRVVASDADAPLNPLSVLSLSTPFPIQYRWIHCIFSVPINVKWVSGPLAVVSSACCVEVVSFITLRLEAVRASASQSVCSRLHDALLHPNRQSCSHQSSWDPELSRWFQFNPSEWVSDLSRAGFGNFFVRPVQATYPTTAC
jgi:hypothetical protein